MPLGPIDSVRVFTRDFSRAEAFYRDTLGLQPLFAAAEVCVFDCGETKLVLEGQPPEDPEADALVGRFTAFSFAVTGIDALVAELKGKGVVFDGEATLQDWGGTLAHFFDPDGNVLTLVQQPGVQHPGG